MVREGLLEGVILKEEEEPTHGESWERAFSVADTACAKALRWNEFDAFK